MTKLLTLAMTEPDGGFGERLREARLNKGLTQRELAKLAGVSYTAVQMAERGAGPNGIGMPRPATVRRYAEALEVTPEYLRTGRGSESEEPGPAPGEAPADREQTAESVVLGMRLLGFAQDETETVADWFRQPPRPIIGAEADTWREVWTDLEFKRLNVEYLEAALDAARPWVVTILEEALAPYSGRGKGRILDAVTRLLDAEAPALSHETGQPSQPDARRYERWSIGSEARRAIFEALERERQGKGEDVSQEEARRIAKALIESIRSQGLSLRGKGVMQVIDRRPAIEYPSEIDETEYSVGDIEEPTPASGGSGEEEDLGDIAAYDRPELADEMRRQQEDWPPREEP
jgi:transcriptional regulator with XRE-family HTH domain